jgi:hypothetical protein
MKGLKLLGKKMFSMKVYNFASVHGACPNNVLAEIASSQHSLLLKLMW